MIDFIKSRWAWIVRRMGEPSTHVGLSGAMISAAALSSPMNYVCIAVSMLGFFLKEGATVA